MHDNYSINSTGIQYCTRYVCLCFFFFSSHLVSLLYFQHSPFLDSFQPLGYIGGALPPHTRNSMSRLVLAMCAWWVNTRRAPSRYCRDARVYDHTTTATHVNEYTSPPPHSAVCLDYIFIAGRVRVFFPYRLVSNGMHYCNSSKSRS